MVRRPAILHDGPRNRLRGASFLPILRSAVAAHDSTIAKPARRSQLPLHKATYARRGGIQAADASLTQPARSRYSRALEEPSSVSMESQGSSRSARVTGIVFVATALITAVVAELVAGRYQLGPIDDAYISLRYAANWAAGTGLVFNPGESVEGYTNFLLVLIEASLIRCGLDPVLAMTLIGRVALAGPGRPDGRVHAQTHLPRAHNAGDRGGQLGCAESDPGLLGCVRDGELPGGRSAARRHVAHTDRPRDGVGRRYRRSCWCWRR